MNTLKNLSYASIGTLALTLMAPSISVAEADQASSTNGAHNLVHRVSHSLANEDTYTASTGAGYKWGKKASQEEPTDSQWAEAPSRGSYKWGNSAASGNPDAPAYAGSASYEWGTMSFSDQAGYRWGMRSFSDQAGYRWGMRSFSDQAGYRWGMRSFSDQTGYRWGMR